MSPETLLQVKPPPVQPGPDKKVWPHNQPRGTTWVRLKAYGGSFYDSPFQGGTHYLALLKSGTVKKNDQVIGKWFTQRNRLTLQLTLGTGSFDTRGGRFTSYDYDTWLNRVAIEEVARNLTSTRKPGSSRRRS